MFVAFLGGCGSDSMTPNVQPDAGTDTSSNLSPTGTCANYQGWVTDAVRSMPRECNTPSDCLVVERAGNCECSLAVSMGSDVAALTTALNELDENACKHPFACIESMAQCAYDTPFEDTELVVTCEDNVCNLVELMTCDTFVQHKNGGLYPAGACTVDADCELRDDLNPCGCPESYPSAFPIVLQNDVYALIQQNSSRCTFVCQACPAVTEALCDLGKCAAR